MTVRRLDGFEGFVEQCFIGNAGIIGEKGDEFLGCLRLQDDLRRFLSGVGVAVVEVSICGSIDDDCDGFDDDCDGTVDDDYVSTPTSCGRVRSTGYALSAIPAERHARGSTATTRGAAAGRRSCARAHSIA